MDGFFETDFLECQQGKKDLKQALAPYIEGSEWKHGIEELLRFWFRHDSQLNEELLHTVAELRKKGDICCLATNQEKYRSQYIRENMGFTRLMDKIYVSCEIGHKKPSQAFFAFMYNNLEESFGPIAKNEITFYDDDIRNVEAGKTF